MRSSVLVGILSLFACGAIVNSAVADFVAGNVVIYRVGDGESALTNKSTVVYLDEYTPAGALVRSLAMPVTASGMNNELTAEGTDVTEGLLTRSVDGTKLVLTGYAAGLGLPSIPVIGRISETHTENSNNGGPVLRTIGLVSFNDVIDTSTTTTQFRTENIRSAAYDPAANTGAGAVWVTGNNSGLIATTVGGIGDGVQVADSPGSLRQVNVFDGQLYISTNAGVVRTVGTGEPITAGQTTTTLPGFPGSDAFGFFFADLSAGVSGVDTLYVASQDGDALTKYSLVSGSWTSNGKIGDTNSDYRGLTASVSGGIVTLFATRLGSELVSVVDPSGYNSGAGVFAALSPTLLATASANTAFRGVALAPSAIPEPGAMLFGGLICAVVGCAVVGRRLVAKQSTTEVA